MDLPDWNEGLKQEASFDCSPVKQPLAAQAALKDGNTQRVSAVTRPLACGAKGLAAGYKPALPAVASLAAPPLFAQAADGENDAGAAAAAGDEAPGSVRRTHTPSRTGLKSRAVRMPSRLGATPGAKQPEPFAVPQSGRAAATGTKAPHLKSILKRLSFSNTKGRAAAAGGAGLAAAGEGPDLYAPLEASLQLQQQQHATAAAAAAAPLSTIKQLRFDVGATPAAAAVGTAARPGDHRHVTFDAATVSPAARGSWLVSTAAAGTSAAAGRPGVAFRTPEPTIQEEDSTEDASSGDGGGTVNSNRAGNTPYDRRLSSLFRKYQVAGTPELPEAELDDLVQAGAVKSPSWKRLSSASVPESIRELSKKYGSDSDSLRGLSASPSPSPLLPSPTTEADAATPQAAASGRSPTLDPTPHHMLNSMMKRNALYESPSAEVPAQAQAAEQPAVGQVQQGAAAGKVAAGVPSPAPAEGPAAAAGQLSPTSALAQLLAPVLIATINEIQADKVAAQQEQVSPAMAAPTPTPDRLSSPAEFYGFPLATDMSTPGGSASTCLSARDGVPRNADGIPTVTPATVTVRRGGYGSGLGPVLEEEDDLAANLFDSFSPAARSQFTTFSPDWQQQAQAEQEAAVAAAAAEAADAITPSGSGSGATPPGVDEEFSFFPLPAASSSRVEAIAAVGGSAAAAVTPELGAAAGGGSAELAPAGGQHTIISPEILGFYEAEARMRADTNAITQPSATPALPRSIIKSGRPLNADGTPVLGHAQRMAAAGEGPPPTITRELQALMADLRLEDAAEMGQMGTVETLSPVRTTGRVRGFLGGLAKAVTPVRRSARKKSAAKPLNAMLEETGFSYVPNAALMPEDAQPKREAAEAKAAKKAAASQADQASWQAGEASLSSMAPAAQEQAEVSSAAFNHRYSTRSTAAQVKDDGDGEAGPNNEAAAAASSAAEHQQQQLEEEGKAQAAASRRMSLRRLQTPHPQQQQVADEDMEAATPHATAPVIDAPVEQDQSPHLQESPGFAATPLPAMAAAATPSAGRSYSLRLSTIKKTRQSMGTPLATPAPAAAANERSSKKGVQRRPQLSPTELAIRSGLRSASRKSRGSS